MIQEYRVGNWVFDPECAPYYFQVEEIRNENPMGLCVVYRNGSIKTIDPEPIPLTTEVLEMCGFEDKEYTMELNGLTFSWGSRVVATGLRSSWSCDQYPHIKYLHQLQNLYFALTGEELTYKTNQP